VRACYIPRARRERCVSEARTLVTDMNQPLASSAGHALAVLHAARYLTVKREARLHEILLALGKELPLASDHMKSTTHARREIENSLESGAASERFQRIVMLLGGPSNFLEQPERYLPLAPIIRPVFSSIPGVVSAIDLRTIGLAIIGLGGSRPTSSATIDHAVDLSSLACIGFKIGEHSPQAVLHACDES
jgi:thymidine phosphorylase